jgi:uncharacterized protein with predicted RNA binding PUA domain
MFSRSVGRRLSVAVPLRRLLPVALRRRAMSQTEAELARLRTVADYQFGVGAGPALFPPDEALDVTHSTGGRPRQVRAEAGRVVSYGTDGRFTLGLEGGRRLTAAFSAPAARVVVGSESEPFVRDGKNVFAKFVQDVDDDVRPSDEVAVVHENGDVLAVGRAELAADAMRDFETGMAVKVRAGAGTE